MQASPTAAKAKGRAKRAETNVVAFIVENLDLYVDDDRDSVFERDHL